MGGENDKSFWVTLPGILTAITGLIVAISGILGTLHAIGILDGSDSSTQVDSFTQVTPTQVTPTQKSTPTTTPPTGSTSTSASTQAEINITYPTDSSKAQMKETVRGTATNIPEGQQLWIVTRWYDNYYPQNYVDIQSDGSWELPVQIGEGDSHGSDYYILPVLADKNAQNEFNNYLNTFEKTGTRPDMMKLPDGSKVVIKGIVKVNRV